MQYIRLDEEKRHARRTIADVVELLRRGAGFSGRDRAFVQSGSFHLPSGETVGVVQVIFEPFRSGTSFVVSLPTSRGFRAKRLNSLERDYYEISALDGAAIDLTGNVVLADHTTVFAVEVVPARLPLAPTELDLRILHGTLMHIGATRCYRDLRDDLPSDLAAPEIRAIDFSRLSGLEVPSLDSIAAYLEAKHPALPVPSLQTISNALRKFGMRIPKARGR